MEERFWLLLPALSSLLMVFSQIDPKTLTTAGMVLGGALELEVRQFQALFTIENSAFHNNTAYVTFISKMGFDLC